MNISNKRLFEVFNENNEKILSKLNFKYFIEVLSDRKKEVKKNFMLQPRMVVVQSEIRSVRTQRRSAIAWLLYKWYGRA